MKLIILLALIGAAVALKLQVRAAGDACNANNPCTCPDGFQSECHNHVCRCHHHGHHPDNHHPDNHHPNNNHHPVKKAAGDNCTAVTDCSCPDGFKAHCHDQVCRCHHHGHTVHPHTQHAHTQHPHTQHPHTQHPHKRAAGDACSVDSDCTCPDGFRSECHNDVCRCHHHGHHPDNHHPDNHHPNNNHHPVKRAAGDNCTAVTDCSCPDGFKAHCHDQVCRCHHHGHTVHPHTQHAHTQHPHTQHPHTQHPHKRAAGDACSVDSDCTCPDGFRSECHNDVCRCHHHGHHPDNHHPDNHHPNNNHHPVKKAAGDNCTAAADCSCPDGFKAHCHDQVCRCHHHGHTVHPHTQHAHTQHPHTQHPHTQHPHKRAGGDACDANNPCTCPVDFKPHCHENVCRCHHHGHTQHPHSHQTHAAHVHTKHPHTTIAP